MKKLIVDNLDLVLNIVKVLSMIAAGVLGLIATFKDFSVEPKAALWKRWMIGGILFTTALSVAIQVGEYVAAQHAKAEAAAEVAKTAETLKGITKTTAEITTDQKSLLTDTTDVREKVHLSLAEQQQLADRQRMLLSRQDVAVSSVSQLLHPIDPLGLTITLAYNLATQSCLTPYIDQLVSYVRDKGSVADGPLPGDPSTKVFHELGRIRTINILTDVPDLPPSLRHFDRAAFAAIQPTVWIRFHRPAAAITFGSSFSVDDGAEYLLDYSPSPPVEGGFAQGLFAPYRARREVVVYPEQLMRVTFTAFGVPKHSGQIRSATGLPKTVVEVFVVKSSVGGCITPQLTDLAMGWGQNYVFGFSFPKDGFRKLNFEQGTSFVYSSGPTDFVQ